MKSQYQEDVNKNGKANTLIPLPSSPSVWNNTLAREDANSS